MAKLPIKITPCPIVEAIVEIRFMSKMPSEAIFGIIYNEISTAFSKLEKLPILQIPEAIRSQDPNLIYQAHYSLTEGDFNLKIGPKVLIFTNIKNYMGWSRFFPKIIEIIGSIEKTKVIDIAERIGLRYINLFKQSVLNDIELEIRFIDSILSEESTNLRAEIKDEDFLKIINVANNVNITSLTYNGVGSLIDIDCIYEFSKTEQDFFPRFEGVINRGHEKEKQTFFSLLKEEFLQQFNPEY